MKDCSAWTGEIRLSHRTVPGHMAEEVLRPPCLKQILSRVRAISLFFIFSFQKPSAFLGLLPLPHTAPELTVVSISHSGSWTPCSLRKTPGLCWVHPKAPNHSLSLNPTNKRFSQMLGLVCGHLQNGLFYYLALH